MEVLGVGLDSFHDGLHNHLVAEVAEQLGDLGWLVGLVGLVGGLVGWLVGWSVVCELTISSVLFCG